MKKALLVSVAVCVLGAGGFAFAAGVATKGVNIRSTGFTPRTVTVVGGDTVQWRNLDTVNHQIVANNGAFASAAIRPNGTYARRMDTPGTFPYHDALKPTLRGTVRVTGAAPSVSAGVTPPIVTAGNAVHIRGAISPAAVGACTTSRTRRRSSRHTRRPGRARKAPSSGRRSRRPSRSRESETGSSFVPAQPSRSPAAGSMSSA